MIHVIAPGNEQGTAQLVASALQRSCGWGSAIVSSIALADREALPAPDRRMFVFIHPREEWTPTLLDLLGASTKLLVL